ncbi:hypothetical protein RZP91_15760, partial [Citrobacter freundii]|uniref:hypothetical protein n=1 Tax=Citrobacter freundii TaxID=546 RepID=UPI00292C7BE6|nr:hypothetical protein [Citrobacter freundii]MEB0338167.1 hypothetical protein [Citrobacter freundii]
KRAYCLKTQPATGETYPKSDLFNKALLQLTVAMFTLIHTPVISKNCWRTIVVILMAHQKVMQLVLKMVVS